MTKWRFTYMPANEPDRQIEFIGSEAERDAFFRDHILCAWCVKEMKEGVDYGDGHRDDPHDNPWATACGCEWEVEAVE